MSRGPRRIRGITRWISHVKPASAAECNFILQLNLTFFVKMLYIPGGFKFPKRKICQARQHDRMDTCTFAFDGYLFQVNTYWDFELEMRNFKNAVCFPSVE